VSNSVMIRCRLTPTRLRCYSCVCAKTRLMIARLPGSHPTVENGNLTPINP